MKHKLNLMLWLLLLVGCSGLGGEPEIIATGVVQVTTPEAVLGYPQSPPDLVNGAAIYAQNCTACHGIDGRGDGELVVSGQVANPGDFRDPTSARGQYPKSWFNTITNGNLENLMPPWKDALTEQERWDVAMYTYTMHYTPKQVELGEILYQDCAECHGIAGQGDGPEAEKVEGDVKDLTDRPEMITLDDATMYLMVAEGNRPMPAYADVFNDEEIWAVVAYARTLMMANADQAISLTNSLPVSSDSQAQATAAPTQAPQALVLNVVGTVSNQTSGATVPSGLTVTLNVFDQNFEQVETRQTPLNADNTFVFEAVAITPEYLYLTSVEYLGRNFASAVVTGGEAQDPLDLPIVLYELTDDASVIQVNAAVTQLEVIGDTIEVQYTVQFLNTSDHLYTQLQPEADQRYKSIGVVLPPGALVVGISNQPRYIVDQTAFTVYDTLPLQPGEDRFMQVTYLLQYTDGAVIEYPIPYAVEGQVRVLVLPETISLQSELLPSNGPEKLGEIEYQGYGTYLTLPANSLIQYTLSGSASNAAVVESTGMVSASTLIPLIIGGIGAVLMVIGGVMYFSRRSTPDKNRLIDGLIRQIAELDTQHEAGQINHDLYRHRREQLKARLAELMGEPRQKE